MYKLLALLFALLLCFGVSSCLVADDDAVPDTVVVDPPDDVDVSVSTDDDPDVVVTD